MRKISVPIVILAILCLFIFLFGLLILYRTNFDNLKVAPKNLTRYKNSNQNTVDDQFTETNNQVKNIKKESVKRKNDRENDLNSNKESYETTANESLTPNNNLKESKIHLRFISAIDNTPVPHARIGIFDKLGQPLKIKNVNFKPQLESDQNGDVFFSHLPIGIYTFKFLKHSHYPNDFEQLLNIKAGSSKIIFVDLLPMISGKISNYNNYMKEISIKLLKKNSNDNYKQTPTIDSNGQFEFRASISDILTNKQQSDYQLEVQAVGYYKSVSFFFKIELNTRNIYNLEIYLEPKPFSEFIFTTSDLKKIIDVDYSIPNKADFFSWGSSYKKLEPNEYDKNLLYFHSVIKNEVLFRHKGYAQYYNILTLGDNQTNEILFLKGGKLKVNVLGKDQKPLINVQMRLLYKNCISIGAINSLSYDVSTDESGLIEIDNLTPGHYILTKTNFNLSSSDLYVSTESDMMELEIKNEELTEVDFFCNQGNEFQLKFIKNGLPLKSAIKYTLFKQKSNFIKYIMDNQFDSGTINFHHLDNGYYIIKITDLSEQESDHFFSFHVTKNSPRFISFNINLTKIYYEQTNQTRDLESKCSIATFKPNKIKPKQNFLSFFNNIISASTISNGNWSLNESDEMYQDLYLFYAEKCTYLPQLIRNVNLSQLKNNTFKVAPKLGRKIYLNILDMENRIIDNYQIMLYDDNYYPITTYETRNNERSQLVPKDQDSYLYIKAKGFATKCTRIDHILADESIDIHLEKGFEIDYKKLKSNHRKVTLCDHNKNIIFIPDFFDDVASNIIDSNLNTTENFKFGNISKGKYFLKVESLNSSQTLWTPAIDIIDRDVVVEGENAIQDLYNPKK